MIGIGKVISSCVTPMKIVLPMTLPAMERPKKRVKFSRPHHGENMMPLLIL